MVVDLNQLKGKPDKDPDPRDEPKSQNLYHLLDADRAKRVAHLAEQLDHMATAINATNANPKVLAEGIRLIGHATLRQEVRLQFLEQVLDHTANSAVSANTKPPDAPDEFVASP